MAANEPAISSDGFAFWLAFFYAGLFVALGVYMPFMPVWLAAKGLDSAGIGIVLAAPMVVRIVSVPLVTRAADRGGYLRAALIITAIATPAGFALVGLASGFWPILVTMALASAAFTSAFPLADAYALRGLSLRGRSYGPVRLWGSAAFIGGSLGAGFLFDTVAPELLIWVLIGVFLAAAFAGLGLRPLGVEPTVSVTGSARTFLASRPFLAVAAAASLIQASHAMYYGFSALAWTAAGLDGRVIGALWALGVVAEIVLFAVSGRLSIGPAALLMLGAAGAVVRWSAMAFDPPPVILPLLQALHGLTFGATHLGAVQFLARAAPPGLAATAQGYLAIAVGVAMAGGTGLSGLLFGLYGSTAYAAMTAAALLGGLILLAAGPLSSAARTGG